MCAMVERSSKAAAVSRQLCQVAGGPRRLIEREDLQSYVLGLTARQRCTVTYSYTETSVAVGRKGNRIV